MESILDTIVAADVTHIVSQYEPCMGVPVSEPDTTTTADVPSATVSVIRAHINIVLYIYDYILNYIYIYIYIYNCITIVSLYVYTFYILCTITIVYTIYYRVVVLRSSSTFV